MATLNARLLGPYENVRTMDAKWAYPVRALEYNKLFTDVSNLNTAISAAIGITSIDCSGDPNYPASLQDQQYAVSVAGHIGGGAGPAVEVGDLIICVTASPVAGTHAAVGTNFIVVQKNMIPCTTAVLYVGTNNTDFVSAKTLKDAGITTSAATIMALAGGSTAQLTLTTSVAQKGLTIGQTAMTSGYAIDITSAIADAATRIISSSTSMSTAFSTGKTLEGFYFTHTSNGTDVTGATVNGTTAYLSSTALSKISFNGHRTVMTGTLSAASGTQVINGFYCAPTALTINSATTTINGLNIDMSGITNTSSAGIFGLYITMPLTTDTTKAFKIVTTTSVATAITLRSENVIQTMTGASAVNSVEVKAVTLESNVQVGNWANAICAKIDFKTVGYCTGTAGVICAELDMPGGAVTGAAGTYCTYEAEINLPTNYVGGGVPIAVLRMSVWGAQAAQFDTSGCLFSVNGTFSSGATNFYYDHDGTAGGDTVNNWMKIRVNGVDKWIAVYDVTH